MQAATRVIGKMAKEHLFLAFLGGWTNRALSIAVVVTASIFTLLPGAIADDKSVPPVEIKQDELKQEELKPDQPKQVEPKQVALSKSEACKLIAEPRFRPPANWHWGYFKNADSATIRYGYATPTSTSAASPIGTIVILPGFTEFGEVYFETAREFLARGYTVYEMDWRGAGGSDGYFKTKEKNLQKYSSLGMNHDVDDLDQFLNVVVRRQAKGPIVIVAHSLGSHLALRYLHDHPGVVEKAVLASPPFDCPGTSLPPWAVQAYSYILCRLNRSDEYVTGQGNWTFLAPKVSKMSTHSHDPVRVRLEEAWGTSDPNLQTGGATWKWLLFFQQSCDILTDPKYASEIKTPILMGCALSDHIADPKHQQEIAALIPSCQLFKGADARHDLFLEDDAHRGPWMRAVFQFLAPEAVPTVRKTRP